MLHGILRRAVTGWVLDGSILRTSFNRVSSAVAVGRIVYTFHISLSQTFELEVQFWCGWQQSLSGVPAAIKESRPFEFRTLLLSNNHIP